MLKKTLSIFLLFVAVLIFISFFRGSPKVEINSFQDCVDAGYPVMESYPRQCNVPGGQSFVEEIETEENFYGSSTNFPCENNEECMTSGCNSEICASQEEEGLASICIFPEEPLPKDLGFTCGCFENECQWGKEE